MFRREALQLEQLQSGANHVHNTNIAQGQRQGQGQGQEQEQGGLMSQQLFQPQQQQQQIPSSQSSQSSQDQNNIQHMSFDYEHDGFTGGHLSNNNGNYQYNDSSYHNEIAEIMETDMGEMDRMLHVSRRLRLRFKGPFLYTGAVCILFHVECYIRLTALVFFYHTL